MNHGSIRKKEKKACPVCGGELKFLSSLSVADGEIISGEFSKGDTVPVTTDGQNLSTQILDVIECSNSSTFETMLAANSHEHTVNAGTSAWILLDLSEGVKEGRLTQK